MTALGTANAAPGEIDTGRLVVGETRDGSPLRLPVCVVNGTTEGSSLFIQAASDGDELNGVGVVRSLVPQLDPTNLAGTILIVGIVNLHAFSVAEHRSPIDNIKLNRTFPGNEHGSSSERIAAAVFEVATSADLVLDLHQASTNRMINETRVRCGPRHHLHSECLKLAKIFDCNHILDQKGPDGQLARAAPDEGVPTIDPELGGTVGLDPKSITIGVEGIFNVLTAYGFLDGDTEFSDQIRATGFEYYSAPTGGLVDFKTELGEWVEQGDSLFQVTDCFGAVKAETTSNVEGVFWRTRRLPQVTPGEYICSVGVGINRC